MLSTTAVRAFSAQAFFLAERSGWLRMAEYEQLVTVVKSGNANKPRSLTTLDI